MPTLTFTIEGTRAIGKERARVAGGHAWTPTKTLEYEALVGTCCLGATKGDTPFFPAEVGVDIVFFIKGRATPDVDNCEKAILDGMQGVAYKNDRQVKILYARMKPVKTAGEERIEVVVWSLDNYWD